MIDREKVIDAIENCIAFEKCKDCPWEECEEMGIPRVKLPRSLIENALELLKEQEPKTVKIKKNVYNHEFYYCPRCDRGFEDFFRKPMFCDKCGQAVKWDAAD